MSVLVDLQRRSGPVERLALSGLVLVGRQDGDIVVDDPAVSRRHIELIAAPDDTLVVRDLGSSNGTYVNGQRVTGETPAPPGTEIRLGDTIFTVIGSSDPVAAPAPAPVPTPDPPASPPAQPPPSGHEGAPTPAPAPTPAGHDFDVITTDEVEVRFRPGSYGEQLAPSVARSVKRARHNLEGVGAEAWGLVPIVSLVDPYLSADGSGELIASGTIVDAPGNQIWMIVSPEAPPEDPHRALALLFGAALPSAAELEILLEGYGLHRSGITDTDEQLRGRTLPHLDDATGELRGLMAVSFVRDLIRREGQDSFRRLLAAPKGKVDDTTRSLYGAPLTQLEGRWLAETATGEIEVDTAQFLRLSLRYLKPYKLRQAEIFVYMLLSLAFTASFPFVTRKLFDDAIPSGEFSEVVTLLVILGVAFVISLVAGVRQAYQSAWVSGAVTRDLRQTLFDRLQRLPASWYHQHPQGDVLSRLFSDVAQVEDGLSTAISQGIFQVISLVVSAAIMLTINLPLALVVLAGAPLVAVVYRGMAKGAQDRSVVVQENSSALMGVAAENNSAAGVVKVFGLASREKRRFGAQANRLFRSERRLQLWGGLFGLSVNLIVTSLRLFVLGFGAWLILEGHFTLGGLVAFLSIMGEVLSPVTVLTTLGQTVQQSMGSLVRINEVLDEPTEADDASLPALAPLGRDIRLVEVGFGYTPQQRALDGLDVSIPVGSRLAFVGPSGSGKSTVLRLLMRMYDPDEGAVLVDGVDLRSCSVGSWRDQLGVVFQDSFLFDTTLRENIALGKVNASEEEVLAAARAAEIDTFVESLERGYDTVVGEGGGSLSGGQRQRVAIARALIRNPRLLLLDEATSALDPGTEKQINETLLRVSKDRTVVAITHRLTSVVDYDRIFVIVAGELSEQGTHEELVALGGVYAHLWSEQTGAAIPESPPVIDAAEALRRVPLFAALDDAALAEVAGRLRPFPVEAGEVVADGGGLVLVESGRLDVVAVSPTATGVAATLGPGDTFGLASVMGAPATSSLSALAPSLLQLLSTRAIAGLAAEHPSIGEALTGVTDAAAVSGTRLSRLTLGPGVMLEEPRAALPNARAEMTASSRATGAFTVPRR